MIYSEKKKRVKYRFEIKKNCSLKEVQAEFKGIQREHDQCRRAREKAKKKQMGTKPEGICFRVISLPPPP